MFTYNNYYIKILRVIFAALIVICLFLSLDVIRNLEIDTSLENISPNLQNNLQIKNASSQFTYFSTKKILLLLTGENKDDIALAETELRKKLSTLNSIKLHPDTEQLTKKLIEKLMPYRFSLLTKEQQKLLAEQTTINIAEQAKASLYTLSEHSRILPFDIDPLGWHSDTLINMLNSYSNKLLSNSENAVIISMDINENALDIRNQESLLHELDFIIPALSSEYKIQIDRSGIFFFAADAAKNSKNDIKLISTVSTIGIVLLLLLTFRSISALILPILSVSLGVLFAFLVTHYIYGKVHVLTIVFGAGLIGIVIDYSLHYFYHKAHINLTKGINTKSHSIENDALHRALLMSLITSLIGYIALSFSDLDALQKIALFSSCGLFMSWLCVLCIGDYVARKALTLDQTILPTITNTLTASLNFFNVKLWIVFNILVISTASVIIFFSTPFDDNPKYFFPSSQVLLNSEQKVSNATNNHESGRYIAISGNSEDEIYQRYKKLLNYIDDKDELSINQFTSLLDWVPAPGSQLRNYQAQSKLYSANGAAEVLINSLSNDDLLITKLKNEYSNATQQILTPQNASSFINNITPPTWYELPEGPVHLMLIKKGTNTDTLRGLTDKIEGIYYINTVEEIEHALAQQRSSASLLLIFAYVLVSLIVLFRYKELPALLLVTAPICSSAMLIIMSAAFGFPLNLFHVMALFLVLGFGMDYMIFAREMEPPHDITLQAIFLSALTSLLSFGLLSISSIPIVSSFGITLLIGNLFNLFGVMIYSSSVCKKAS